MIETGRNFGIREQKEQLGKKPYVVSGDIKILLSNWAKKEGFRLPSDEFFDNLRLTFSGVMRNIFPEFELIPEEELVEGIQQLVTESGLTPISLDRVYYQGPNVLDMTRLVDESNNDKGVGKRPGSQPLLEQFRRLQTLGAKDVALIDDVVFSGGITERIIRIMRKNGFNIPVVITGVAVGEGINRLQTNGVEVRSVCTYTDVIDQVCERDFYPGVPYCGRTLLENTGENAGVPYLLPFGNPNKWASIPDDMQFSFSNQCFRLTERLFNEIAKVSGKEVFCQSIDRKTLRIRNQPTTFANALEQTRLGGNKYPRVNP